MNKRLSETEFAILGAEVASGAARMSISRSMARQFFTRVRSSEARELRGIAIVRQKFIIYALLILSIALIFACLGLVMVNFGWGASVIAIPLTGIFWTVLAGFTTETGSWLSSSLIYVAALGASFWVGGDYLLPLSLFASSLYLFRIAHILAEQLLVRLIMGSFAAYEMLAEHIVVTKNL